jgi:hypothetical protein
MSNEEINEGSGSIAGFVIVLAVIIGCLRLITETLAQ